LTRMRKASPMCLAKHKTCGLRHHIVLAPEPLPAEVTNAAQPNVSPACSVDVMLELLNREITIADDTLDEVADGDNAKQLFIIDDQ
jgi:hypothetical protein